MRLLEAIKEELSGLLTLELDDEKQKMVDDIVTHITADIEEQHNTLAQLGKFAEDGSYTANENKTEYYKQKYLNVYMGREKGDDSPTGEWESGENDDVHPMDDVAPSTDKLDEILGRKD